MNQLFGSLAILSILCSVAAAAVPPCETMVQELTPCQPYLTDTAASPTDDCCNGAKNIATYIVTQRDRTDVCECLKPTAVARADDPFRISALPGVCGVQIPLPPVTADTDCSTFVSFSLSLSQPYMHTPTF